MVRLRRAELKEQIAADTARLLRVEVRLKTIAKEGHSTPTRFFSSDSRLALAGLTGTVAASLRR